MRVKRFVATSIEEAMSKIKRDMGPQAVILHTRYFKEGGFLGFFQRHYVEVTAATEEPVSPMQPKNLLSLNEYSIPKQVPSQDFSAAPAASTAPYAPLEKLKAVEEPPIIPVVKLPQQQNMLNNEAELTQELSQMKNLMSEMTQILEVSGQVPQFPKVGQNLYLRLKRQEVEDKLARKIVKATLQQLSIESNPREGQIEDVFRDNILKSLKKGKPIKLTKSQLKRPKIFALVGPTGVGKTTTIAKLAAMFAITEQQKVAFITVDTYRIAAVEQLKTIAEIMDVPIRVVYSVPQIQECLMELVDRDLIFIDTAGRSHKNSEQLAELKVYLDVVCPDETFLVMSSTSKYQDMLDILKAYQDFEISRLIFTKIDETSFYGSIYNIACKTKIPLAYLTTGQDIPDDIEAVDNIKLAELIMKES